MSTTAALTAINAGLAAQSSINASRAEDAACEAVIAGFDAKTADVPRQKQFATCVQRLHPEPYTGPTPMPIKAGILILFAAMIFGFIHVHGFDRPNIGDRFMGSIGYAFITVFVFFVLGAVGLGVFALST